MLKSKLKNSDLQKVKDQPALFALLRETLGWPLIEDDESLVYPVADVGNVKVQQLLPFADDDPWLILLVEFEGAFERDDVRKALRAIRRQQKQHGKYADKRISDILFICTAQDYKEIEFVRFIERGSRQPKLKVFGWNPDTQNQNKTVCDICLPALTLEVTDEGYPDWSSARWNQAWDIEKVTIEFFKGFDTLRTATFEILRPLFGEPTPPNVKDDPKDSEANWAVSVQLNRLLFVYFLADQGFLPGGVARLKTAIEAGNFHAWFRTLALDALGSNGKRPEGFENVPYLNGGLFVLHETEQGRDLVLPDNHYREWLKFLGSFRWTLSENEGVNTISPHILGYLFERYINQKQMGAYYTKEDVTGYICRSTVIPRLFDKIAETRGKPVHLDIGALSKEGNWRYIFPSVKQRGYLPTETSYEHQRRQARLRQLEKTDLHGVDDFVTNNLNLELLAEDWLATRKDPAELLAAYDALQSITILDPTVGSGAFLLAALDILAPLYDFALRRMEAMIKESGETIPDVNWAGEMNLEEAFDQKVLADPAESETISTMRNRLAEVAKHANSGYFIRKRIMLNNLYGVDVMPEAVEICKLRLYLALVSAASSDFKLEPLPDVDLNYRAGNALVGFATLQEIQEHFNPKGTLGLEFGEERLLRASVRKIQEINRRQEAGEVPHELIEEVEYERRAAVQGLNLQQANMRGLTLDDAFLRSHRPFHWLAEYPTVVLERGGFDCVVGNPPYVEYRKVSGKYKVLPDLRLGDSDNLYAFSVARAANLLISYGRIGMILPTSIVSLDANVAIRQHLQLKIKTFWFSTFAIRPSKLFEGVDQRLAILIGGSTNSGMFSSRFRHWTDQEREHLLANLELANTFEHPQLKRLLQMGSVNSSAIHHALKAFDTRTIHSYLGSEQNALWYNRSPRYWIRATNFPPFFKSGQRDRSTSHVRILHLADPSMLSVIGAILNSSLFFFWFLSVGNGRNITEPDIWNFPVGDWSDAHKERIKKLFDDLMKDFERNSHITTRVDCSYQEFDIQQSKSIIDEIDCVLAEHYGIVGDDLKFIINYDIKYRMGREGAEEVE